MLSKRVTHVDPRREIPSVGSLLSDPDIAQLAHRDGNRLVTFAVRNFLDRVRKNRKIPPSTEWINEARAEIDRLSKPSLRRVINATGVLLHTNLGRAPFAPELLKEVLDLCSGYLNLEFDLNRGERGSRYVHCVDALRVATGAEDALIVNNNAAAVMLSLRAIARGKEVVISRGELVEIGGSFRIPEILEVSGAKLREVGTTNRTRASDYTKAIGPNTAMLLKVHPSNYRIEGFVESVSERELVDIARKHQLPLMIDVGTGVLQSIAGAPKDLPTVSSLIEIGVDIVTFSGDKLLGGPQAGIILGKASFLETIRSDPWLRIVRVDKLTLALMERLVRASRHSSEYSMVARLLLRRVDELRNEAKKVLPRFKEIFSTAKVNIVDTESSAGGGSLPQEHFPSVGIEISAPFAQLNRWEKSLRGGDPAVVGRRSEDSILFDLRTILPGELEILLQAAQESVEKGAQKIL